MKFYFKWQEKITHMLIVIVICKVQLIKSSSTKLSMCWFSKLSFLSKNYLSWIVVRWPDVELDLSKVTFSTICRQQSGKAYMRSFKVSIITEDAVFLAFLLVSGHLVTFFILYPVFWYWNAVNSYPILGLCMSAELKTHR